MIEHKTFHALTLTPIIFGLKNAAAVLRKGEAHAKANGIEPSDYLNARLYPDMDDLCSQVYRFTDAAKGVVGRCNPSAPTISIADDQKTFPELLARIAKTLQYLESIETEILDGREDEEVVLHMAKNMPNGPIEIRLTAWEYVLQQVHPNFWFHVTTMYDILRHKGVPVGKMDFLNGAGLVPLKWLGLNV